MKPRLEAAMADCLSRLEAGQALDDCLAHHPEFADELRPLLSLARDLGQVPMPRARLQVKATHQKKMLATIDRQFPARAHRPGPLNRLCHLLAPRFTLRWAAVLAAVLVLLLNSGWWSVTIAAHSLPGDLLYPVKRTSEQIRLSLTFDPAAKEQLDTQLVQERLHETQQVLIQKRQARVEFKGRLKEIAPTYWIVGQFQVQVTTRAKIEGQPIVGARVRVQAQSQADGTLVARRLQMEPIQTRRPPATTSPPTITPSPPDTASPSPSRVPRQAPTSTPNPPDTPIAPPRMGTPTHHAQPSRTPPPNWTPRPRPRPRRSITPPATPWPTPPAPQPTRLPHPNPSTTPPAPPRAPSGIPPLPPRGPSGTPPTPPPYHPTRRPTPQPGM